MDDWEEEMDAKPGGHVGGGDDVNHVSRFAIINLRRPGRMRCLRSRG
jgi:hypothetical protein